MSSMSGLRGNILEIVSIFILVVVAVVIFAQLEDVTAVSSDTEALSVTNLSKVTLGNVVTDWGELLVLGAVIGVIIILIFGAIRKAKG